MFENKDSNIENIKEVPIKEVPIKDVTVKVKAVSFPGPYKIGVRVIKSGGFRLDGKLYNLNPGDTFDGAKLSGRKLEILRSTKYVENL